MSHVSHWDHLGGAQIENGQVTMNGLAGTIHATDTKVSQLWDEVDGLVQAVAGLKKELGDIKRELAAIHVAVTPQATSVTQRILPSDVTAADATAVTKRAAAVTQRIVPGN